MKKTNEIVILRCPQVQEKTGLCRSTLYKLISDDNFPRPIKLGPRTSGWVLGEVEDWLAERIARRDAE